MDRFAAGVDRPLANLVRPARHQPPAYHGQSPAPVGRLTDHWDELGRCDVVAGGWLGNLNQAEDLVDEFEEEFDDKSAAHKESVAAHSVTANA